ncbi:uncharacterized protein [Palaemon carinicauda]|uniref:uncharacterized protein n=1 Tax=Palaemon carinicauda TaxID=392227 RepID=UPI0035B67551
MNSVADATSRNTLAAIHLGLDYNAVVQAQRKKSRVPSMLDSLHIALLGGPLLCDVRTGRPRPWILAPMCQHVFFNHGLSHPSRRSTRRFALILVDVVGPLLTSQGHPYLFTVIDHSTRWPEAIPVETATSASCTSALLSVWITRFNIPEHSTFDRGSTFISQLWVSLANLLEIALHQTTAYNPPANGMV